MHHQAKKHVGVTLHRHFAEFRVWAPFATLVQVVGTFSDDKPVDLVSEQDGYWYAKITHVEAGHHYKYLITTEDGSILEKNDPRARVISTSNNGFSIIADNDFDWGNDTYITRECDAHVIYEMHIGTFNRPDASTSGTFETAIEKLDYLKELGVTTIELMPVTSMTSGYGWGYAPNHLYSVESNFGGRYGLMNFVKACHQKGLSVILDVVYNHFAAGTDLWQFDGWNENDRGGIYFYSDERGDTPWGGRPDYGRVEVQQFILDNVAMWFNEYHIDGLRVDSTIYMRNTSGRNDDARNDIPEAWSLMQHINHIAHTINPHALLIAEDCAANEAITLPESVGGAGFDSQWELGFPHALRHAFGVSGPAQIDTLTYELSHRFNDTASSRTIFIDSHDTAANGSVRLNEALSPETGDSIRTVKQTLLSAVALFTAPGIPMILQGNEFLQEGSFNDWKELDWSRADKHSAISTAFRHLADLRLDSYGSSPQLLTNDIDLFHVDKDNLVVAYTRDTSLLVVLNLSNNPLSNYSIANNQGYTWIKRFDSLWNGYDASFISSLEHEVRDTAGSIVIELQPHQAAVFTAKK